MLHAVILYAVVLFCTKGSGQLISLYNAIDRLPSCGSNISVCVAEVEKSYSSCDNDPPKCLCDSLWAVQDLCYIDCSPQVQIESVENGIAEICAEALVDYSNSPHSSSITVDDNQDDKDEPIDDSDRLELLRWKESIGATDPTDSDIIPNNVSDTVSDADPDDGSELFRDFDSGTIVNEDDRTHYGHYEGNPLGSDSVEPIESASADAPRVPVEPTSPPGPIVDQIDFNDDPPEPLYPSSPYRKHLESPNSTIQALNEAQVPAQFQNQDFLVNWHSDDSEDDYDIDQEDYDDYDYDQMSYEIHVDDGIEGPPVADLDYLSYLDQQDEDEPYLLQLLGFTPSVVEIYTETCSPVTLTVTAYPTNTGYDPQEELEDADDLGAPDPYNDNERYSDADNADNHNANDSGRSGADDADPYNDNDPNTSGDSDNIDNGNGYDNINNGGNALERDDGSGHDSGHGDNIGDPIKSPRTREIARYRPPTTTSNPIWNGDNKDQEDSNVPNPNWLKERHDLTCEGPDCGHYNPPTIQPTTIFVTQTITETLFSTVSVKGCTPRTITVQEPLPEIPTTESKSPMASPRHSNMADIRRLHPPISTVTRTIATTGGGNSNTLDKVVYSIVSMLIGIVLLFIM
uniref:ARAD1A10868p n=1 Tax=Blastobotrys adeninivorans TaxID=409370 RepID=A0A060SYA3_BLAAD